MADSQPLLGLTAPRSADRLRAVRELERTGAQVDLASLRRLRAAEVDGFVQSGLDVLIARQSMDGTDAVPVVGASILDAAGPIDLDGLLAQAIQDVGSLVIHEVRTLLGRAKAAACAELGNRYSGSRTELTLDRISDLLDAIKKLEEVAAAPSLIEFDLTEAVAAEVRTMDLSAGKVTLAREDAVPARGDWSLLAVAFRNGLLNALEASVETGTQPVVVTWGSYPQGDAWVSVLDEGPGLSDGQDVLSQPGRTSKRKEQHLGWGLAIADRAMRSCGGKVTLRQRETGGAIYELVWSNIGARGGMLREVPGD